MRNSPQRTEIAVARLACGLRNPKVKMFRRIETNETLKAMYSDPVFLKRCARSNRNQIKDAIEIRLNCALNPLGIKKKTSAIKMLGCTIPQFLKYLESKFRDGMDWTTWGIDGWHMDHVRPCASFDLRNESEQRACFHFTNIQPLWAYENHSKHARYEATAA